MSEPNIKKRFLRLLATAMSKKIVAATVSGGMCYHLIMQGKFGTEWLGPATAFGIWMTFVGHVFNIDLKTKEIFTTTTGLTKQERAQDESLYS